MRAKIFESLALFSSVKNWLRQLIASMMTWEVDTFGSESRPQKIIAIRGSRTVSNMPYRVLLLVLGRNRPDMKKINPMFDILFCLCAVNRHSRLITQIQELQNLVKLSIEIAWRKTSCSKSIATSLKRRTFAISCWYYYYLFPIELFLFRRKATHHPQHQHH